MNICRNKQLYLVFEYIDKNLLEVLEDNPNGIEVSKQKTNIIAKWAKAIHLSNAKSSICMP